MVIVIVALWATFAPAACLILGLVKGIEYGERLGAEEMRRSMLRHPAIRAVKQFSRSA